MSVSSQPESRQALIARIKGILLKPKEEWAKIDGEPATIQRLYTGYVVILAAAPVLCRLIGGVVFGYQVLGISYRPSLVGAIGSAITEYVLQLVVLFIIALIIDALAPTFGGQKNRTQAFKLVAYAGTAGWIAGCFGLFPPIGFLAILGFYGFYLLYVGIPVLMKAPADKALAYTATIVIAVIVVGVVMGYLVSAVMPRPPALATRGTVSGQIKLPGGASLDLNALQRAAGSLQSATQQAQSGAATTGGVTGPGGAAATTQPIAPDTLKALLPDNLGGGFGAGQSSTGTGGIAGLNGSTATTTYNHDNSSITLTISDLGALGAMASLAGAFSGTSSEQNGTSYSKVATVDGRMTKEEYDSQTKAGSYAVLVAGRVMIEAEGSNVSMDDLKSALGKVNLRRVESLVK